MRRGTRRPPSRTELLRWFKYDPEVGEIKWVKMSSRRAPPGTVCRSAKIGVPGVGEVPVTHVIWKIMTGQDVPDHLIVDHRDRDSANNKWTNLRLGTNSQNTYNTDKECRGQGGSGVRGVRRLSALHRPERFVAYVRVNGKPVTSPIVGDLDKAIAWRRQLVAEHFGEFAME